MTENKWKWLWTTLLLAVAFLALYSTTTEQAIQPPSVMGVYKAVRVFMHEPSRYTVLAEGDDGVIRPFTFQTFYQENVRFFRDVDANQSMWVECELSPTQSYPSMRSCSRLDIHVRSAEDVNGAGWDHGKNGKGMTTVVQ